eukprot:scaffold17781_cov96-Cylindrotheca_fusiformis.AAC.1
MADAGNVLMATPDGPWDPHSKVYALNEDNMCDFQGRLIPEEHRPQRIVLEDLPDDDAIGYLSSSWG